MAKQDRGVYLGKEGIAHGPYSAAEIERMRLSGEIQAFTYLWDTQHRKWQVMDPMPPDPEGARSGPDDSLVGMGSKAICHNANTLVGGVLENVSELGCDLVCTDPSESPKLLVSSLVLLNVTDRSGNKGMNLRANLAKVSRRGGRWIYRIRWARRPSF